MMRTRILLAALALVALAAGLSGCFNPFDPRIVAGVGISESKPVPKTEEGVVELFRWCWINRSIGEYREVFSDDYVFTFSATDSAGNTYRDKPWIREDELISAENLFVTGKGGEEAATSITLEYGNNLNPLPDPRPGKNRKWHKYVNVDVVMVVKRQNGGDFQVQGSARFFVVRGDSAKIPTDTGLTADSTRWYIERWEDDTAQSGALAAELARARPAVDADAATTVPPAPVPATWGALKKRFR